MSLATHCHLICRCYTVITVSVWIIVWPLELLFLNQTALISVVSSTLNVSNPRCPKVLFKGKYVGKHIWRVFLHYTLGKHWQRPLYWSNHGFLIIFRSPFKHSSVATCFRKFPIAVVLPDYRDNIRRFSPSQQGDSKAAPEGVINSNG